MIVLTRSLARQLRSVLRRAFAEQKPPPAGPVVCCRAGPGGLTVDSVLGEIAVRYQDPQVTQGTGTLAFHGALLATLEGRKETPVTLTVVAPGKGQACWTDGTGPRVQDFPTVAADAVPAFPALPAEEVPVAPEFLSAFDQASRVTARDNLRYPGLRTVPY